MIRIGIIAALACIAFAVHGKGASLQPAAQDTALQLSGGRAETAVPQPVRTEVNVSVPASAWNEKADTAPGRRMGEDPGKAESFGSFFDRYAVRDGFTSVVLGRKMMQMMSRQARNEDRELSRLLAGIRSIRILAADKPDETFCDEARRVAETGAYQLMSSLSEGGQYTCFYLYDGGRWGESEFLMLTFGQRENVVVEIVGVFDVREVSRLSTLRPK